MTRVALIVVEPPCAVVDRGTKSPKHSLPQSSLNSDYMFHPISPDRQHVDCNNEDMSCISSDETTAFCHDGDAEDDMDFTPYPFTTTEQELDDWDGLETSLGADWSLRLASQLLDADVTTTDDDIDATTIVSIDMSIFEDDQVKGNSWEPPQESSCPSLCVS